MKRQSINNEDRRQWILNDEGLYTWYRGSRLPMSKFISQNREDIDRVINNVTNGTRNQHYLIYG